MFSLVNVNWVEVIIAVVAYMVIGGVWYSKLLFAKEWMGLVGKSEANLKKSSGNAYVGAVIAGLVTATVLSLVIEIAGVGNYIDGAMVGALLWLGFVATSSGVNTLFEGSRKKLWIINNGYQLVSLLVMGAVIGGNFLG